MLCAAGKTGAGCEGRGELRCRRTMVFFCLIILAYSLSRLWRRTFYPFFPSADHGGIVDVNTFNMSEHIGIRRCQVVGPR